MSTWSRRPLLAASTASRTDGESSTDVALAGICHQATASALLEGASGETLPAAGGVGVVTAHAAVCSAARLLVGVAGAEAALVLGIGDTTNCLLSVETLRLKRRHPPGCAAMGSDRIRFAQP